MLSSSLKNIEFKARYFCLFKYFRWTLSRFHGDKPKSHHANIYLFKFNIFHTFFWCFYCWFWKDKCLLEISFIIFKSSILPMFYRKIFCKLIRKKTHVKGLNFCRSCRTIQQFFKKTLAKNFSEYFCLGYLFIVLIVR